MILFWKFKSNIFTFVVELPPTYHSFGECLLIVVLIHFITYLNSTSLWNLLDFDALMRA